jgi:Plasmid encoded RepA protein
MARELTPVEIRRMTASVEILDNPVERIAYQHTVFCQTCLPYRSPGGLRVWERRQGAVFLRVEAGAVRNPQEARFVDVGLPFGSRPRLILAHLNREALLRGTPRIDVEASLTGFIRRVTPNNAPNTRDIARFKDQLTRFAASSVRMACDLPDNRAYQVNTHIIESMELWLEKDERQRVLWPAFVELSPRYFESLTRHAVPLDERAIAALSNSPMALDVYAWLGQRLCRVSSPRGQFVSWGSLYDQFGQGFARLRKFRETFLGVLRVVQGQYRQAKFDVDEQGMILHESRPPIPGTPLHLIKRG